MPLDPSQYPLRVPDIAARDKISAWSVRQFARQGRYPGAEYIAGEWRFPEGVLYVQPPRKARTTKAMAPDAAEPLRRPARRDLSKLSAWRA